MNDESMLVYLLMYGGVFRLNNYLWLEVLDEPMCADPLIYT